MSLSDVRLRTAAVLVAAATLMAGCQSYPELLPEGYAGPKARIIDGGGATSDTDRVILFCVTAVDGVRIRSGLDTVERGYKVSFDVVGRDVPIRPLRLKLVGTQRWSAPILDIRSQVTGTNAFSDVEGEIDFTPEPGKVYVVDGEMTKDGSAVWITTPLSKTPVSAVVRGVPR